MKRTLIGAAMINRIAPRLTRQQPTLIVGVLLILSLILGCEEKPTTPEPASSPETVTSEENTEPTEDLHLQVVALEDVNAIIAETAERDKVLVIDFWATWCVPCVEMFPALHEGLVARGDAVRAVTVTLDDPSREPAAIEFLVEHDALHDAYIFKNDSAEQQALADGLGEKWDSLAVPAILVFDAKGNLVGEYLEGGSTDAILEHVDRLLGSDKPPAS